MASIASARRQKDEIESLERSLVSAIGRENVSRSHSVIARHSFDALRRHRGFDLPVDGFPPDIVVTPRSTPDVSKLVKLAKGHRTPLTPWGAGTGLQGGAAAVRGGVTVDFRKMRRIIGFDRTSRTVEVEAGATLGAVNRHLQRRGYFFAHDPWTRDFATVGGAISTNGVGYLAAGYGTMGDQVVSLQAVLPDGSVLETEALAARSGFDLDRLFIGTEGIFGLITRATLLCRRRPAASRLTAYDFKDFGHAFEAALKLDAAGPTLLDVIGEGDGPGCKLYVMASGERAEVEHRARRFGRLVESSGGSRLPDSEARSYWRDRHKVAERYVESIAGSPMSVWGGEKTFDYLQVALPPEAVVRYWERARRIVEGLGIEIESYGIFSKPGLFSLTLKRGRDVAAENLEFAVDRVVEEAVKMDGYFEYVHGIGIRYGKMMQAQNPRGISLLRSLKESVDPGGIMNPGKMGL